MPVSPDQVEYLAATTGDLYADAEAHLLGIIARQLEAGLEAPGWAVAKLQAITPLRRTVDQVLEVLAGQVSDEVRRVVAEAYASGQASALAELGALTDEERRTVRERTPGAPVVERIAAETINVVTSTHRSILRAILDRFRQIIAEVVGRVSLGIATRRQATQEAMRRFADRGIRAFRDRAGRTWQLTSYAEMAVRTATARAATEAHAATLRSAGIRLVIVSDAPRECPLCRPWERRVLALDGPDGAREVEVEHATDDGVMVRIPVAGTLDEARRAGLQHPNCRHSVSAFLPGVTTHGDATSDPEGYEAGQRQRAIERHIRRWKRREQAAVTDAERKQARRKVRQWQAAMRQHLKDHPYLQRIPAREQIGGGNAPTPTRTASPEAVQAARIRAGERLTPREMSDEQLAAAMRAGVLDERDMQRVADEIDRRELQALLDRVRPGGRLVDDLTGFSDDELGRVLPHLDTADTLRVAAEMDRRDLAARMPDVNPDLVGLSDEQLAVRARNADGDTLAAIAAEANRRDLLKRLFPGGRLREDLADVGDDELSWALRYADPADAERIADEFDRRYPPGPLPDAADTGDAVADMLADRQAIDDALDPMGPPEQWGADRDDQAWGDRDDRAGEPFDDEPLDDDRGDERDEREERRITVREAAAMYDEWVWQQFAEAEAATNGYMLNRRGRARGISPEALFSGPAHVAYAYASRELYDWWAEHPRMTKTEFIEKVTGRITSRTARARIAEHNARIKWRDDR